MRNLIVITKEFVSTDFHSVDPKWQPQQQSQIALPPAMQT